MQAVKSQSIAIALLALALSFRPAAVPAQSRNLDDYVLLADQAINASRLTVTEGDVIVLDGSFTSTRALAAPHSAIPAPSVQLDDADVCGALFATNSRGGGAACGDPRPFSRPFTSTADACGFPLPFPPCEPLRPPVVVPHGATLALPPGVYGDIRVEGGAGGSGSLLLDGSYGICNFRASRGALVQFTGISQLLIGGTLTAGNGARFVPAPGSGVTPALVNVFVAGSLVRLSRKGSLALRLCAPRATLRVGSRGTLTGRFATETARLRQIEAASAIEIGPNTPTAGTTATLRARSRCSDGPVDPREVCDGDACDRRVAEACVQREVRAAGPCGRPGRVAARRDRRRRHRRAHPRSRATGRSS
jgi:hypothetical protein